MAYTNIDKPSDYFNTITWTGSDSNGSRSFTGVGFQPDLVWSKSRTATYEHLLYDSVRTAGNNKELRSNSTGAEGSYSNENYGYLSSFDSDGFSTTIGSDATYGNAYFNDETPQTYVAWNWLAGGTAVSNTQGSITSTVSASTTSGFSIVSYTGNATNGATVGHGLGVAPSMFIIKNRSSGTTDWAVYNKNLGSGNKLLLNSTDASSASSYFNSTSPTSTVLSVNNSDTTNGSGNNMIAYCFAEKKGFSKFGSFNGNGNADGTFVYTGFKPAFIITKITSETGSWFLHDNKRNGYNGANNYVYPNASDAELTTQLLDITSNGFKMRFAGGANSSGTSIYMAFAESPFTTSTGIPTTAR